MLCEDKTLNIFLIKHLKKHDKSLAGSTENSDRFSQANPQIPRAFPPKYGDEFATREFRRTK